MKKKFIIVLFIALAGTLSVTAQSKKKKTTKKAPAKKTTKTVTPVDTAKAAPLAVIPSNNKLDTIKSVPDSDDGYLKSIVITKARPFPIFEPSSNNVKEYHQYKRDILLKDPRNAKFNTPGSTVIEALMQAAKDGILTPYSPIPVPKINPNGDAFTIPMTYAKFVGGMIDTVTQDVLDKDGNKVGIKRVANDFDPSKVVGYRIKEDVYYDKQRAKVETRILGIAPLVVLKTSAGDTVGGGPQPACWFKYKQCRIVFAKMDVSDADHNLYDVSMDDMFLQRQFNSVIVEESNPKGNRIKDYATTPEAQAKEAARIEKKLADYKNNIWKYQTNITAVAVPEKAAKTKKATTTTVKPKTTTPPPADNNTGTPVKP